MFPYAIEWPQFFTAVIYDWLPILEKEKYKNIIISSLQYMVSNKRIELSSFVLMKTHIHLIWQPKPGYSLQQIQLAFMKYTAQQIKLELMKFDPELLEKCRVNKPDRKYQIWKRESLSVELDNPIRFKIKMDYIHYNPVVAGFCKYPEEYYYSSAKFYQDGKDPFNIVTHFMG
ncbi:MAG: transposase [Ferruginibacter sp.]